MDLSKIDLRAAAEDGAALELLHPQTEEPIGVFLQVVGRDSPSVRAKVQEFERKKAKGRAVDEEEFGLELLCAVVKGWENLEWDGEALPYTYENARKVFSDPRAEWIAEQVGPFVMERVNFLKGS